MTVQDDKREEELRNLFQLEKPKNHSRGGVDSILKTKNEIIEFELKSTTKGSVTTVRDFGLEHIRKWEKKHWIIGVYSDRETLEYCLHATPSAMQPWIQEKKDYIAPDFTIGQIAANKLEIPDLYRVLGKKNLYSLEDAKKLHKKQYSKAQYIQLMDLNTGYSPQQMLKILRDRALYISSRGSTLNNPHVPASYFNGWTRIVRDHAAILRKRLVQDGFIIDEQ